MHRSFAIVLLTTLAACATRAPEVVVAPPPPPPVVVPVAPAMPVGASPGMAVPAMLADGTFPTPNVGLSEAATMWHLRAGLNVAALACRSDEARTIARYNALLSANRVALTAAETAYAAEFKAGGGDWRDRYDDAMTRLYNYWSTAPARTGFCAAAGQVLADAASVPAGGFVTFARDRLPVLDRAFVDFYRAYDAWRRGSLPPTVIASAAAVATDRAMMPSAPATQVAAPVAPVGVMPAAVVPVTLAVRLEVDRTALADDRLAGR